MYKIIHNYHHNNPTQLQFGGIIPWTDIIFRTYPE